MTKRAKKIKVKGKNGQYMNDSVRVDLCQLRKEEQIRRIEELQEGPEVINTIHQSHNSTIYTFVTIHGKAFKVLWDTGAAKNCIDYSFLQTNFPNVPLEKIKVALKGAGGNKINVVGKVTLPLDFSAISNQSEGQKGTVSSRLLGRRES